MILDEAGELAVVSRRGRELAHRPENREKRGEILEVALEDARIPAFRVNPVQVRPLPEDDSWFETTWAAYGEGRIHLEG